METERVELLLKIIAEELYWARQERTRTLNDGIAELTNEAELFREGAVANIDLLRRDAGL